MHSHPEILRGTLDLLVLKALTWRESHGYAIARWIERATSDALAVGEGALYPALHRMENRGWLSSEWGWSDRNRRVKYYRMTQRGRAQLRRETAGWEAFVAAMGAALSAETGP